MDNSSYLPESQLNMSQEHLADPEFMETLNLLDTANVEEMLSQTHGHMASCIVIQEAAIQKVKADVQSIIEGEEVRA